MSNRIQFNSTSDLDALVAAFPNSFPPSSTATPLPDYENTPLCRQKALFFHHVPALFALLLQCILVIFGIIMVLAIRSVTPGVGLPEQQTPEADDIESTDVELESHALMAPEAQSIPTFVIDDTDDTDHPPPYQPPAAVSSPASFVPPASVTTPTPGVTLTSTPQLPLEKRSSAHLFVRGTTALIPLIFSMFLLALLIQCQRYCTPNGDRGFGLINGLIIWGMYSCCAAGVSIGVVSWVILLRNLWGPATAKRYPIDETIVCKIFFASLLFIVAGPFMLLWYGGKMVGNINVIWAEGAIEWCQRRCCGDAPEVVDREDAELEEGVGLVGGEESGENSVSQSEGAEVSQRAVEKPVMR